MLRSSVKINFDTCDSRRVTKNYIFLPKYHVKQKYGNSFHSHIIYGHVLKNFEVLNGCHTLMEDQLIFIGAIGAQRELQVSNQFQQYCTYSKRTSHFFIFASEFLLFTTTINQYFESSWSFIE